MRLVSKKGLFYNLINGGVLALGSSTFYWSLTMHVILFQQAETRPTLIDMIP